MYENLNQNRLHFKTKSSVDVLLWLNTILKSKLTRLYYKFNFFFVVGSGVVEPSL